MIDDPDELAEALADAGLPDQQVGRLNVPGSDTEVLWIQCSAATARAARSPARDAVPHTGRWPLVTSTFGGRCGAAGQP